MGFFKSLIAWSLFGALAMSPVGLLAKPIKYEGRFKAKYPSVEDGGSIGVVNFSGKDGDNFASTLSGVLQSAVLDGHQIFTVKTIDSMNYKGKADTKAEVAAAIRTGQKLGVKTVFTGTVTTASVTVSNFTKQESVCAESKKLLKCERSEMRNVPCTKAVGQYAVTPRALRVDTGTVAFAETVSTQGQYLICDGQVQSEGGLGDLLSGLGNIFGRKDPTAPQPISSPDALLTKMRQDAADLIRRMVAPYNKTIEVNLKERTTGLSKEDNKQFESAIKFGNAGRMDRACSMFELLFQNGEINKSNVPLLYNMGVCEEVTEPDRPVSALEYYAKADQLLTEPDKLVSDAYLRMKAMAGQSRDIKKR